jgi:flagella basal body P-ring formation protein FlgA
MPLTFALRHQMAATRSVAIVVLAAMHLLMSPAVDRNPAMSSQGSGISDQGSEPLVFEGPVPGALVPTRVAVATRRIARGATLTAADIAIEERQLARGVLADTSVAEGWTARRIINPGEILRPPAVRPPIVVRTNDPVDVVRADGAVTLSLRGHATRDAAFNERITIRLLDGRRIEATIVAPGKARLD